jgi:copper homeostasis protein
MASHCGWCSRVDVDLFGCSVCNKVVYCGTVCQEMHWTRHSWDCYAENGILDRNDFACNELLEYSIEDIEEEVHDVDDGIVINDMDRKEDEDGNGDRSIRREGMEAVLEERIHNLSEDLNEAMRSIDSDSIDYVKQVKLDLVKTHNLLRIHRMTKRNNLLPQSQSSSYTRHFTVEACVSDIESAENAVMGGCNSLELCSGRPQGGVTPSYGFIKTVVDRLGHKAEIHVLIRPRDGDFFYTEYEKRIMIEDIRMARQAGAHGFVCGGLIEYENDENEREVEGKRLDLGMTEIKGYSIDYEFTKHLRFIADRLGLMFTFHRAIDQVISGLPVLEVSHVLTKVMNVDRILTSAGYDSAVRASNMGALQAMVYMCRNGPLIIAAAGIQNSNVRSVLSARIQGVHVGSGLTLMKTNARRIGDVQAQIAMGVQSKNDDHEWKWSCVSLEKTKEFLATVRAAGAWGTTTEHPYTYDDQDNMNGNDYNETNNNDNDD